LPERGEDAPVLANGWDITGLADTEMNGSSFGTFGLRLKGPAVPQTGAMPWVTRFRNSSRPEGPELGMAGPAFAMGGLRWGALAGDEKFLGAEFAGAQPPGR